IAPGKYNFDTTDGHILMYHEEIVDGYYYENGLICKGKGVIEIDDYYYYVLESGKIFKDGTLRISKSKTNGLIPAGTYVFDAEGHIQIDPVINTSVVMFTK
ncbi:MAG: hypothetical protein IJO77_02855, partial [Oscillospiraceae bacterium]|nr:hypothetical protein [Oscillospiraceae bacterium]